MMNFTSYNPATGQPTETFACLSADELEACVDASRQAAQAWRQTTFAERSALLNQLASLLSARRHQLALCMSREMGKLQSEALVEVDRCALECAYFAAHGQAMLPLARSLTTFEPMGSVLLLTSWRFPLWQVFRMLAPTLMAGNGVLLKLAENLPQCAQQIEQLVTEAGGPAGLVSSLLISKADVARLIEDPRVKALAFSGNKKDASLVAALAGQHLKKVVLELDEIELQIVLDDADLDLAVDAALRSRFRNAGQLGHASRGFIVTPAIADDFVRRMTARLAEIKPGDPQDMGSTLGPLATGQLRQELHQQVTAALADGARAVLGCELPSGKGWYYPASLLDNVGPEMAVFRQQLSGPLACVVRVADVEQITALCNSLGQGGTASIWTRDLTKGEQLARSLSVSACFVNAEPPQGRGRPLAFGPAPEGRFNIKEFCYMKSLVLSV